MAMERLKETLQVMWINLQILRYCKLIECNTEEMERLLLKNKHYKRRLANYENMICGDNESTEEVVEEYEEKIVA
jgi:hypothetical protein